MSSNSIRRLFVRTGAVVCVAAMPFFLQACGKSNAEVEKSAKAPVEAVNVKVERIQPQAFVETIQVTGAVEAYDDVMVPAEEAGKVREWVVQKGSAVRAGQVIARIDDVLLRSAYDAANAGYQLAEVNYSKQKKVFEEKAISELQLKTFEYQRDAAKAQADLAKARVEKCAIKSPISGVLDMRMVDAGEMIGPGAPIARVVSSARLKVTAGVPERYAGLFKVGDQVKFTVDALPGEVFTGRVSIVGAAVSRDNRSVPIEVAVAGSPRALKPEMIASLTIALAERPNSIVIREDYMQQADRDQWVVYVANGDIAEERPITIGATSGGSVLVRKGLSPGDRLITIGHQNVASGQKINVMN